MMLKGAFELAKHTARDRVYLALLETLFHSEPGNKIDEVWIGDIVSESDVSERTVRDVFKTVPFLSSRKLATNEVVYDVDWNWFDVE